MGFIAHQATSFARRMLRTIDWLENLNVKVAEADLGRRLLDELYL